MKDAREYRLGRVAELDGLRGFLASWVFLAHVFVWCGIEGSSFPGPLKFLWVQFSSGAAAVDVFIILSGFAISYLLHGRAQSHFEFMRGRFFRIYPVYLICLLLGLASTFLVPIILQAPFGNDIYFRFGSEPYNAAHSNLLAHLFWHLTLLNGLVPSHFLPAAGTTLLFPAWSITLEWQYYLVAPFLARGVRSAIVILLLPMIAIVGLRYGNSWQNPLWAFLPVQLPLFLIGIASYHLFRWFKISQASRSPFFAVPVAALLAVVLLMPHFHPIALALWALTFGSVFVQGGGLFSWVLAVIRGILMHPWLQFLGKISYSLYLLHWPLIIGLLALFVHFRPAASYTQAALFLCIVGVPLILLATTALHHLVEAPGMAYGKRLADRRNGKTPASSPIPTASEPAL